MVRDLTYEIVEFMENADDIVSDCVDRMEFEPVALTANLYVTGIKRDIFSYTDVEFHVKQIRTIKLPNLDKSITDDDGLYMMEPDGEMWLRVDILSEDIVKRTFEKIKDNFSKLKSFHLMTISYNEKGRAVRRTETILYKNKRVACKEALKYKKMYENVIVKFEHYAEDKINGGFDTVHEPTDYEIAVAAAE